ncbi:MAG: PqqD family protein [Gammaproteobacteria bacterium]|nr:PqqD family protein [Gammaproteobacteria bacterium]
MCPKQRDGITIQAVGDEMVVLDQNNDQIHQLNATASLILSHCDGEKSALLIADELVRHFAIDQSVAISDVHNAIVQLRKLELVH